VSLVSTFPKKVRSFLDKVLLNILLALIISLLSNLSRRLFKDSPITFSIAITTILQVVLADFSKFLSRSSNSIAFSSVRSRSCTRNCTFSLASSQM